MKSRKAIRYSLIFAIVALIISFLIVYVQHDTLNSYNRNLPFIALEDRIKNDYQPGPLWVGRNHGR